MTRTASVPRHDRAVRFLRGLLHTAIGLFLVWGTMALWFAPVLPERPRQGLSVIFAAFCIWGLWLSRRRWPKVAVLALCVAGVAGWAAIKPSHDRHWREDVAVMPRMLIDGDNVRITGWRNFDYRSTTDFTVRRGERTVQLSRLRSVDFFISYWVPGPVAHTFVSFNFEGEAPVAISIEARPEIHEGFDPVASLFKHFELIYVVGDERDLVRLRTNFRKEDVYLYHTNVSEQAARRLFQVYAQRVNELADDAEFYHLLSNNCTINIVRYANLAGRVGSLDIRLVLNGWSDRYLFSAGLVDTSLPFEELRARSNINAAAQAADQAPDFSQRIRAGLPQPVQNRP